MAAGVILLAGHARGTRPLVRCRCRVRLAPAAQTSLAGAVPETAQWNTPDLRVSDDAEEVGDILARFHLIEPGYQCSTGTVLVEGSYAAAPLPKIKSSTTSGVCVVAVDDQEAQRETVFPHWRVLPQHVRVMCAQAPLRLSALPWKRTRPARMLRPLHPSAQRAAQNKFSIVIKRDLIRAQCAALFFCCTSCKA